MFAHIFKYRIKCLFGGRAEIFWTLIYPIMLAIFFSMAFSNLSNVGKFEPVEIAVVDNEEYRNAAIFRSALDSVSQNVENRYFNVTLTTQEDAEERLGKNSIKGYVILENGPRAVVKATGIDQTILTGFLDSYLQTSSAYMEILSRHPEAYGSLQNFDGDKSFVRETNTFKSGANSIVVSYFALISMAAMFGGFRGNMEVENTQANLTPQAARMNLVPIHKLKIFSSSLLATILIQFVSLVLLVSFIAFVLNISFGSQLVPVLITCLLSSHMGVTFGAVIASLVKSGQGVREGILVAVSLVLSSLAGMVYPDLKHMVTQVMPFMAYVNPAHLISDSFYTLYYYGAGARFYLNSGLLLAFSVLFTLVVYLVTRRQKYASL